ncbi:hypothetical protein GALL_334250 [mine drainage metagenome]|uniref:Cytochrome b561 bacterial/Ni-hydrogenase domain-containing protein n=1 Tax=mine drainage metagenome TaxID=410659 RepID=A0A1J5R4U5_9ZZZZ
MIKVWSIPIRLMHWILVAGFTAAFYTRGSELMRDIHIQAGYVAGAVIAIRWLLGFLMRDFSSFRRFPPNPIAGAGYLSGLARGKARRYISHNPAGALAIYAMLVLGTVTVISGYMSFNELSLPYGLMGQDQIRALHSYASSAWTVVIGAHLLGVLAGSLVHRENLPLAMITGKKVRRLNPAGNRHPEISDITIPEFMRIRYIEEAAYYIAERHGFESGRAWDDWLQAENSINAQIKNKKIAYSQQFG